MPSGMTGNPEAEDDGPEGDERERRVISRAVRDPHRGLQVTTNGGETVISGQLADQAALHGLLTRVRDLGLCLISVRRLDPR